jgi:hypothetical protein
MAGRGPANGRRLMVGRNTRPYRGRWSLIYFVVLTLAVCTARMRRTWQR